MVAIVQQVEYTYKEVASKKVCLVNWLLKLFGSVSQWMEPMFQRSERSFSVSDPPPIPRYRRPESNHVIPFMWMSRFSFHSLCVKSMDVTMRVEHLVGLVVSSAALKDDRDSIRASHSDGIGWLAMSLSGTNSLPLAAPVLPDSFLPELLCRAAAIWGSSFLRRLVVSCT